MVSSVKCILTLLSDTIFIYHILVFITHITVSICPARDQCLEGSDDYLFLCPLMFGQMSIIKRMLNLGHLLMSHSRKVFYFPQG